MSRDISAGKGLIFGSASFSTSAYDLNVENLHWKSLKITYWQQDNKYWEGQVTNV